MGRPTDAGIFDIVKATIRGRETGPSLIAPDGHAYTGDELDSLAHKLTDVARAPYFHNGMAETPEDVVDFYNARFHADFTPQEKPDLVNFLK